MRFAHCADTLLFFLLWFNSLFFWRFYFMACQTNNIKCGRPKIIFISINYRRLFWWLFCKHIHTGDSKNIENTCFYVLFKYLIKIKQKEMGKFSKSIAEINEITDVQFYPISLGNDSYFINLLHFFMVLSLLFSCSYVMCEYQVQWNKKIPIKMASCQYDTYRIL